MRSESLILVLRGLISWMVRNESQLGFGVAPRRCWHRCRSGSSPLRTSSMQPLASAASRGIDPASAREGFWPQEQNKREYGTKTQDNRMEDMSRVRHRAKNRGNKTSAAPSNGWKRSTFVSKASHKGLEMEKAALGL